MQDLPAKDPDREPTSEQQLSSSVEQLTLSPTQLHDVQTIRDELRFCALYTGVGVICNRGYRLIVDPWKSVEPHLSSLGYKIIGDFPIHLQHTTCFTSIAHSIQPPTDAELSDSHPFVIAVFLSGSTKDSGNILDTEYGPINIVDNIIRPFLPQSAPHLQHIPKLFFITVSWRHVYSHCSLPNFSDDPDGNYCVAYHMAGLCDDFYNAKWAEHITERIFFLEETVQEAIENSRFHLDHQL